MMIKKKKIWKNDFDETDVGCIVTAYKLHLTFFECLFIARNTDDGVQGHQDPAQTSPGPL